jgi:Methyltransferase domain
MTTPVDLRQSFFERHYWSFLRVREAYRAKPEPIIRYWKEPGGVNDFDRAIFAALASCGTVLDVGAGDLLMKQKVEAQGFRGRYLTLDPTREFAHDYHSLDEVPDGSCDGVVILEVVEHIELDEFFSFMEAVLAKLRPSGVIVLSTPNADFVGGLWSSDFTHVHAYRGSDLAAYLHFSGYESTVHRVAWRSPRDSVRERIRYQLARVVTRGILQVDYARGILLIARHVGEPQIPVGLTEREPSLWSLVRRRHA